MHRGVALAVAATLLACDGDDAATVDSAAPDTLDARLLADGPALDGPLPDARPPDIAPPDSALNGPVVVDFGPDLPACTGVVCDVGFACDPETGQCEPRPPARGPAGACSHDPECPDGTCRTGPALPGGFCAVACADHDDCGPGAACDAASADCVQRCGDERPCRPGWTCLATTELALDVCRPDCQEVGCARALDCIEATGACEDCRYPCGAEEVCTDGHCLRQDRTCTTSYHCRPAEEQCDRGQCRRREFALCGDGCGDRVCTDGRCRHPCEGDDDCPANRVCEDGVCAWLVCEGAAMACEVAGAAGGCIVLPEPVPAPAVCVAAGEVATGAPCDEVTESCEVGALCFGDPDDPLDPDPPDGRGVCRPLCDPDEADCLEDACVRLAERALGLCLPADCSVRANDCGDGRHCRPYALYDDQGLCGPAGQVDAGCESDDDCPTQGLCISQGAATRCLLVCTEDAECAGDRCHIDDGWAFGLCL